MIYIFAPDKTTAEDFILEAHLFGEQFTIISGGHDLDPFAEDIRVIRFEVADEVFVLESSSLRVKREAQASFDRSAPFQPHVFAQIPVRKEQEVVAA